MRLLAAGRIGEQFHHGERREYQGWLKQSGDLTAYEAVSREMNDAIARQTAIFFGGFDPRFRRHRPNQQVALWDRPQCASDSANFVGGLNACSRMNNTTATMDLNMASIRRYPVPRLLLSIRSTLPNVPKLGQYHGVSLTAEHVSWGADTAKTQ